jgi:hypothetical protein
VLDALFHLKKPGPEISMLKGHPIYHVVHE